MDKNTVKTFISLSKKKNVNEIESIINNVNENNYNNSGLTNTEIENLRKLKNFYGEKTKDKLFDMYHSYHIIVGGRRSKKNKGANKNNTNNKTASDKKTNKNNTNNKTASDKKTNKNNTDKSTPVKKKIDKKKILDILKNLSQTVGKTVFTLGNEVGKAIIESAAKNPELIVDILEKTITIPANAVIGKIQDENLKNIFNTALEQFFPMLRQLVLEYKGQTSGDGDSDNECSLDDPENCKLDKMFDEQKGGLEEYLDVDNN